MSNSFPESKRQILEILRTMIIERMPEDQAERVVRFVTRYYARVAEEVLAERDPMDLYGAALAHWGFARRRALQQSLVRVYNPSLEESGWECPHTVVEIVTDDMPFLVDSVRMALNRHGLRVLYIIHPIVLVQRDPSGLIADVEATPVDGPDSQREEATIHVEVVRQADKALLRKLEGDLLRVLADVRRAVGDWPLMRQTLFKVVDEIESGPPPVDPEPLQETMAFLRWMADDHYTFLGYRSYELAGEGDAESLAIVAGSGLGILREGPADTTSHGFADLPPALRERAKEPRLLVLTKANARSTVHRPVNLDYVGVKRFDGGRVIGEHRFLGLYGSQAYSCLPQDIPILRRVVARVTEEAGFAPHTHSYKALRHLLETYPRDELFQISSNDLFRIAMGILELNERQQPRLFLRQDLYGRFITCLVFVPRERYDTRARQRIQRVLGEALNGAEVEFKVNLSEAPMARILFTVRTRPGEIPRYDPREIESRIVDAVHSWHDHLQTALLEHLGEQRGSALYHQFGDAFPAGYREDFPARTGVHDIMQMVTLDARDELRLSLYRPLEALPGQLRFKVFRYRRTLPLSKALPMLEHMGVRVEDERPYRVEPAGGEVLWVHDFGLAYNGLEAPDTGVIRSLFQDAFSRVWGGSLADDGFNALVLKAGLGWRQIALIRTYAKYLRQTSLTYSQAYMEEAMNANPAVAGLLLELFEARFDPTRRKQSQQRVARIITRIQDALDAVASLDHDRILRSFLVVVQATLRTNYFQRDADGEPKQHIALKLDPARIPELAEPRPKYEIFVYSPRMEGVHLRGGKVARGGLRWSDRREDFRTEVLGLMKAQLVKNAVIVPVGAKGGFVVKLPREIDPSVLRREVEACYRQFIAGLLDLTDNLRDGRCIQPPDLVRYDSDDTYLVVAADKGTATFSDIANEVAADYGFWLGDAFASGGRAGYDHKKMGITARGAWEAVRQHFHAAGIDYQQQPFTVVGIGDMSGDVFGNGVLWSRNIKLLAAFDHRHIFIDPDPDPAKSFAERERLFRLPASSWADYDSTVISEGGGVYRRDLKSVHLSEQAREALDIRAESLTPTDLIQALLKAPVDLLWNGGIGTYIKAFGERNAAVGDRVNDALRINAPQLRCRVVGEGGNLGLTQRARVQYAQRGGRIDTDFIHNAGGVNCSDHEVNIKILLDRVVVDGDMTLKQRDRLLQEMTDEVGRLVLQDSYWQTCAISVDQARGVALLPEQARFMRSLEPSGQLNRPLELLPNDDGLRELQTSGKGLTRPELALLLSYAKHSLYNALLDSDLPEDPCMAPELERYFPTPLRRHFRDRIHEHRLRREILASTLANRLINRFGSTFVFRLQEELGVSGAAVARVYAVVWEVFTLGRVWSGVARLEAGVPQMVHIEMLGLAGRLAARTCRWLLQRYDEHIQVSALIERYRSKVETLTTRLPELLDDPSREALRQIADPLEQSGVPPDLADRVAGFDPMARSLDLVHVAEACDVPVEEAAQIYFGLGADLDLQWLGQRFAALPSQDRWRAGARSSLRDDLFQQHRALCMAVLRSAMDGTSAKSKREAWHRQHHTALERYRRLIADLRSQREMDMAMLTVALTELRRLVEEALPDSGKVDGKSGL